MLLDDPYSALDDKTAKGLSQYLQKICREQKRSIILVTHSIQFLVDVHCIVMLKKGCELTRGTYQELMIHSKEFYLLKQQHQQQHMKDSIIDATTDIITNNAFTTNNETIINNEVIINNEAIINNKNTKEPTITTLVITSQESLSLDEETISLLLQKNAIERNKPEYTTNNDDHINTTTIKSDIDEHEIDLESSFKGRINKKVYKEYIYSIGLGISIMTVLCTMLMQSTAIGMSFWWGYWAMHQEEFNTTGNIRYYICYIIYVRYIFIYALCNNT